MSRRKGRYERRQQKRREKLLQNTERVKGLENAFTYRNMYLAGKQCCNGVRWKQSTQNFERHLFSGTARRRKQVLDGTWKAAKYTHFILHERGKVRPIDAPRIQDRQVHKVLTQKVLLPLYLPSMIYNNGASLPGKGYEFSKRVFRNELRRHFRKYGRGGWVILLDFKKFFPSVSHEAVKQRHRTLILNDDLRKLADDVVDSVEGGKGLPLGVEPSQAEMIAFPSAMDNFIKCQLSIKGAGHYMDDYYILVPPNRNPYDILRAISVKAETLMLTISHDKTKIVPLTRPFKYCKAKYYLTKTGKVIVNGNRDGVKRARRKIRNYKPRFDNREMDCEDLWTSVNGILAYFGSYNNHERVLRMRRYFYSLFGFSPEHIENFRRGGKFKMEYIAHRRYKGKSLCGVVNIPALTKLQVDRGMILYKGKALCSVTSENAHQYFAVNDDGEGITRGMLTQAIQKKLAQRKTKEDPVYQARWDAIWSDDRCQKYKRKEYADYWLWNNEWFNAPVEDLRYIYQLIFEAEDKQKCIS